MRQRIDEIAVPTRGAGFYEITQEVGAWIGRGDIGRGLLTLFIRHTSASLVVQENADPDVLVDLENFFRRAVAEDPRLYRHSAEGPDDMPAHIRAALTQTQLSIPIDGGRMLLGTWQGIYVFEHRHAPTTRRVALHVSGE
jgi:secondary thiamine-phosphate synthase enzyme